MDKKRIVISLDGTWNNPYQEKERDDGTMVFKPSNPLKAARGVPPVDSHGIRQITYYDIGVGAANSNPGSANKILRWFDNKLGGAWGAGFEGNIEDAFRFVVHNFEPGDEIFVFGFSRGAGEARGLCRLIDWMGGIPAKRDAYYAPRFVKRYLEARGQGRAEDLRNEINDKKETDDPTRIQPFIEARVKFLGVWDTVLALGSRVRANDGTSVRARAFHAGRKPAECVDHARQALAIDERRFDFRPEIWEEAAGPNQTLEQRWFAGCHSNVGGGYVHDGLANLALNWILREATDAGLELDQNFLAPYRGYPMDQLYDSRGLMYKIREAPLFLVGKGKKGVRDLLVHDDTAGLDLDESVLHRLNADPDEKDGGDRKHPRLDLYRPKNLRSYLATRSDLHGKLSDAVREWVTG